MSVRYDNIVFMAPERTWTDEQLRTAVMDASSVSEVVRVLGLTHSGASFVTVKRRIANLNLDMSHFTSRSWERIGNPTPGHKVCGKCRNEKLLSEFNQNASKADGLQTICRECQRVRSKDYYQVNRMRMRRQIIAARNRRRAVLQQFVISYLRSHPCVDCGEADLVVLDFDHVRGVKEMAIADMIARERPLTMLQNEIAKCDVRCANCHRRKTMRDQGAYRWLEVPVAQMARAADS
jgi:hypothetical protein